ncbi:MAG: zf-HC2 domain-containing protein, partial [Pontiellaceae bacterium]|nr:zf-HC2 domain-containing protein [Pontiellaceae bacterium]
MHYNSDQLRDYQFGLLDESETAAIAVHLKTCADCRAELERIQQQFSALDLLKEQPAVSEATVAKTVEAIATSESTPPSAQTTRKMIPFRSAAAALAAAASIAIIFGLFGRDRSPNGPDESRTAGI